MINIFYQAYKCKAKSDIYRVWVKYFHSCHTFQLYPEQLKKFVGDKEKGELPDDFNADNLQKSIIPFVEEYLQINTKSRLHGIVSKF